MPWLGCLVCPTQTGTKGLPPGRKGWALTSPHLVHAKRRGSVCVPWPLCHPHPLLHTPRVSGVPSFSLVCSDRRARDHHHHQRNTTTTKSKSMTRTRTGGPISVAVRGGGAMRLSRGGGGGGGEDEGGFSVLDRQAVMRPWAAWLQRTKRVRSPQTLNNYQLYLSEMVMQVRVLSTHPPTHLPT